MDTARGRMALAIAMAVALVWLNAYIAQELFAVANTGSANAMHGFWIALAKGKPGWLSGLTTSSWWPHWDGGMPIEYVYAPLFPAMVAGLANLANVSEARALHLCLAAIYVLAPASLFWCAWRLTGSLPSSFIGALLYSVTAPALLLAPGPHPPAVGFVSLERLYLIASWDEAPHMLALAIWPFAVLALFRIAETRSWAWIAGGALAMAAMVYASAFGATILAVTAICVLLARRGAGWQHVAIAACCTYLAACQALPPSLFSIISAAAKANGHGWTAKSWAALFFFVLVVVAVDYLLHKWTEDPVVRFFVLITVVWLVVVWEFQFLQRQFLPQPGRYKVELSLCIALVVPLLLRGLLPKMPLRIQIAMWALGLSLCGELVIAHRKWVKPTIVEVPAESTIEYRAAMAIDRHIDPMFRVMLAGSIAQWANAYTSRPQFAGGSWSTAMNPIQQLANTALLGETGDIAGSMTWFRAFGVGGVMVSGSKSPEFWKPFADPGRYENRLEKVWSEEDTTLYRVPLPNRTLAHAVPCAMRPTFEWSNIVRFTEAIAGEASPGIKFEWKDRENIAVTGNVPTGQCVTVQVNHHVGWHATVNGQPITVERDGIGLIWLQPQCNGNCSISLHYDGGFELRACRIVSNVVCLGLLILLTRVWLGRARKGSVFPAA